MEKVLHRGLPFSPEVAPLVAHMPVVDEYRESLLRLQGVWDSLALLGQMSGTVPDIGGTRSAFESLTATLLDNQACRLLANLVHRQRARAQVAIDILVRNLFERTADVGFLATDSALREHVQLHHAAAGPVPDGARHALEARFRAYVAKYSVYDDIVVLSSSGRVLARLDRSIDCEQSRAPWIAQALRGDGYVEHHGAVDVLGGRQALVYATQIRADDGSTGVLCLSFRFDNEMQAIHGQLLETDDPAVIALIDADGRVVSSSDAWQIPAGAPLRTGNAFASHQRLRFAGRDYLALAARPTGYEGYRGPGWSAVALLPIAAAFEAAAERSDDKQLGLLSDQLDTRGLFDAELLSIKPQARRIQHDLARLLWNGKLRSSGDASADAFAATLLGEVGRTGERIRAVFDKATTDLHRSTLAAVFDQAQHHARLAIDIMDRNLYERANDCRWWALDGVLQHVLTQEPRERDTEAAAAVLRRINGLYTVYSLLVLFDTQGCVVAVSDPAAAAEWRGQRLDEAWVRETLALRDSESHAVSRHVPSALYGGRATYVYAAALRSGSQPLGGIAIVFDGAPQFKAMLGDALPRGADGQPATGACGLLVSRAGEVIASTHERWPVGSVAPTPSPWTTLPRGSSGSGVIDIDGVAHAVGYAVAGGYREYPVTPSAAADDVTALVLVRLGQRLAPAAPRVPQFVPQAAAAKRGADRQEIASFLADLHWLGMPAAQVVEAIERPRVAALPHAPAHLRGMVLYDGRMLPLIDLSVWRNPKAAPTTEGPVVIAQTRSGQRLALQVQALGPVFELAPETVQHVACGRGGEQLVRGEGQVLSLLDVQTVWDGSAADAAQLLPVDEAEAEETAAPQETPATVAA